MNHLRFNRRFASLLLLLWAGAAVAAPLGTVFTYQGRLLDTGGDANGNYDLRFALHTTSAGGTATATITNLNVAVSNGLFTTTLDFGAGVFTGNAYWLELGARPNGGGDFTPLSPRQELTPTPYALYATSAPLPDESVTSAKILDGTVATADLADSSVTSAKIVNGAVANVDLGADAVTSAKILDGTILGADLENNTVTSAQLADGIDLGSASVSGLLNVYRTAANTPGVTLDGGSSTISTYGSDGLVQTRLAGTSWGQLLLYDNTGNDNTAALNANYDSGGSLILYHSNNATRVSLEASFTSGDFRLYSTNGTTRSRLHGGSDGSYLNLYAGDGSSSLYLDGDDGGGGSIGVRNTNGLNRVFIDGQGNSGGGQINLYTGDGDTAAILYGDVGGGAQFYLYNTNNALRLWLDGFGTDGGGEVSLRAGDNSTTVMLYGDSPDSEGGEVSVAGPSAVEAADLVGQSYGGRLRTFDESGADTVLLGASTGAGGFAYFYQADGEIGVNIDGDNTGAGYLVINKTNGSSGIILDGYYNGNARVITEELQITGGSDLSEHFDIKTLNATPQPGLVVCIDAERPGELAVSTRAYDRTVAGVISGAGGVKPGMVMGQSGTKADGKHPVALTGRVYCLADAANGAIQPGDLLTTSCTPGHAMKVTDHAQAQGAVIGKAMTGLSQGKGLVLVLVSLQ